MVFFSLKQLVDFELDIYKISIVGPMKILLPNLLFLCQIMSPTIPSPPLYLYVIHPFCFIVSLPLISSVPTFLTPVIINSHLDCWSLWRRKGDSLFNLHGTNLPQVQTKLSLNNFQVKLPTNFFFHFIPLLRWLFSSPPNINSSHPC